MPETENGSLTLEQAQEMVSEFSAVNLDEVAPEVMKVAFREYIPRVGGHGFMTQVVTKEIETWVPFFLFNRMLANQKRVQKLRRQRAALEVAVEEQAEPITEPLDLLSEEQSFDFDTLTDELFKETMNNSEPAIIWQAKEVLTIWKLTPGEEQMSLKRLVLGLSFEQIEGLFMRFFGAMLRRRQIRA